MLTYVLVFKLTPSSCRRLKVNNSSRTAINFKLDICNAGVSKGVTIFMSPD